MLSRRTATAALALGLVVAWVGTVRAEQDRATPQEVIQRVQQAAQELAKSGEAGLATFSSKNPTSVWKDSYTFVQDCKSGSAVAVANPVRPGNKGKSVAQTAIFGPKSGEQLAAEFCTAARQPHGGWLEYNFPKPGETQAVRKVSYMLAVQGTPYVIGAGIYDENAKVEDLDKLTGGQQ